MIHPNVLEFLKELSQNNSKEWFDENRKRYQEVRTNFYHFISILIHELSKMDPAIGMPEPKNCIFRINRDIRFSPDKRPYKTNFGAYIAKGGRKSFNPGYYLHIEPGACFTAGGMYMPPAKSLKAIREEIFYDPSLFRDIIEDPEFKSIYPEINGERLKTAPQGYPKDHPDIDLLRPKSYTVSHHIADELVTSPGFLDEIMRHYLILKPLNNFLNRALEHGG